MIADSEPHKERSSAVALFRGLADPTRLAILEVLADGEARVVDLTRVLSLAQSSVSAHMACLRECGLVTGRVAGRQVFYSLASPDLLDLLASADVLLRATGADLDRCSSYGSNGDAGDQRTARGRWGAPPPARSADGRTSTTTGALG